jgi:hypothetical protein
MDMNQIFNQYGNMCYYKGTQFPLQVTGTRKMVEAMVDGIKNTLDLKKLNNAFIINTLTILNVLENKIREFGDGKKLDEWYDDYINWVEENKIIDEDFIPAYFVDDLKEKGYDHLIMFYWCLQITVLIEYGILQDDEEMGWIDIGNILSEVKKNMNNQGK